MAVFFIPVWKDAPFVRLIIPFISGIAIAGSKPVPVWLCIFLFAVSAITLFCLHRASLLFQYRYGFITGIATNVFLIAAGIYVMGLNDTSGIPALVEEMKKRRSAFAVTIVEPFSEKPRSWKALARLETKPHTYLLLYIKKDSGTTVPVYGSPVVFSKPPSRIRNMPAYGHFDYVKFCSQKNIYYQVFLTHNEFRVIDGNNGNNFDRLLFSIQAWVIHMLKTAIPGEKECGLAQALLIGYKDDVDKSLIQAYSNTGVIHVVAISGLHLGLIYIMLKYLCVPFGKKRYGRLFSTIIIISGLWIFSLLAGASPSVLRSALMFSAIVLGDLFSRNAPIYNSLAFSAFFLLSCNPYWLWDLGFQLSYAALLSLAIFTKPVYELFFFKNQFLSRIWKLNAVTIAAQILTTPLCIYYFHQFPNAFLLTNFVAVPVSGFILVIEIILCLVSFFPPAFILLGKIAGFSIRFMNNFVEWSASLPFSITSGIDINIVQLIFLYLTIAFIAIWLLLKEKRGCAAALVTMILFVFSSWLN